MKTYSPLRDTVLTMVQATLELPEPEALFTLMRRHDPSGVSGTGPVATGEVWPGGLAFMRWNSATPSIGTYPQWTYVPRIHGHGGSSHLRWDTRPPPGA